MRNLGPLVTITVLLCLVVPARAATVVGHGVPLLRDKGATFKDLNRNGRLDPYEDWRLPVARRVDDLVSRMTVAEKAGMMMFAANSGFVGPDGTVLKALAPLPPGALKSPVNVAGVPGFDRADKPSPEVLVRDKHVRWIAVSVGGKPSDAARWANHVQEMAEADRLGIPVVLASDPIHTTNRLPGGALPPPDRKKITSSWPDETGLGAIGDPAAVERFGEIGAAEFRALGLRMVLNPIADVTTEPRWNRIPGAFGEDAKLDAKLTAAYVTGFQGRTLGPDSVLTSVKHFPGDGPVKNGLDPHNPYGQYLTWPAHMLDYHLQPFRAGIAAGTATVMTSYGIPEGIDTVASAFSKPIVTGLLRDKLGFRGIVLSDWLHAMPWGIEGLTKEQREARMVAAGVDQFGGEHESGYLVDLVGKGDVSEARLDESVRRLLRPMFEIGLFENPYVDPAAADRVVNAPAFAAAGNQAQRDAIVLLKNSKDLLPLKPAAKLALSGFAAAPAALAGRVVSDAAQADAILVKVEAPYVADRTGKAFFKVTHQGPLVWHGADNAADLTRIEQAAATGKPVIVVVGMERPAVLTEWSSKAGAILATFGSDDDAVAAILTGAAKPRGRLPFDLPADEASVEHQREDAPHDFANTLFRQGFGLTYPSKRQGHL